MIVVFKLLKIGGKKTQFCGFDFFFFFEKELNVNAIVYVKYAKLFPFFYYFTFFQFLMFDKYEIVFVYCGRRQIKRNVLTIKL